MSKHEIIDGEDGVLKCMFMQIDELKSGDLLLCYSDSTNELVCKIKAETRSEYTHAAIFIDNDRVLEVGRDGVQEVSLSALLHEFIHMAVFRHPDVWDETRKIKLNEIAADLCFKPKGYNWRGLLRFKENEYEHQITIYERLVAFSDCSSTAARQPAGSFFCSELIVYILAEVGFITPSAQTVYDPKVYSPGSLGRDPTFGFFAGYLTAKSDYRVPTSDEFYHKIKYTEIFEPGGRFL